MSEIIQRVPLILRDTGEEVEAELRDRIEFQSSRVGNKLETTDRGDKAMATGGTCTPYPMAPRCTLGLA
jgi:hypothetical protein